MSGSDRAESDRGPTIRYNDTLAGANQLVREWVERTQGLLLKRRTAPPPDRAVIDGQVDRVRQEIEEELKSTGQSEDVRRMKQLALEEVVELRDQARRDDS